MNDKQILQWAFDALSEGYEGGRLNDVLTVLRDRLTQPEPWVKTYSGGKPNYTQPIEPEPMIDGWPLYSGLPQFEPEPVAVVSGYYGGHCVILPLNPARIFNANTALYTAPPQREWVGLTKAEFNEATNNLEDLEDCWIAIEAKLKEKNNG